MAECRWGRWFTYFPEIGEIPSSSGGDGDLAVHPGFAPGLALPSPRSPSLSLGSLPHPSLRSFSPCGPVPPPSRLVLLHSFVFGPHNVHRAPCTLDTRGLCVPSASGGASPVYTAVTTGGLLQPLLLPPIGGDPTTYWIYGCELHRDRYLVVPLWPCQYGHLFTHHQPQLPDPNPGAVLLKAKIGRSTILILIQFATTFHLHEALPISTFARHTVQLLVCTLMHQALGLCRVPTPL